MRKRREKETTGHNVWRSYSDMMAGILLLFVLIMCVTLFQSQINYENSIKEQQEKAVAEADKLIANKILDVIRTMLCKDCEVQSFEYTEARKAYFTEQMICEILMALEQTAMSFDMEYDDRQKAMSTDLSKAARKEWYLRHKDKGLEP